MSNEIEVRDKEERRLKKIKIGIMRNPKFALWSGLMTIGKTAVADSMFVPTACTNGKDEFYGREFIKSLSDKELTFVVMHETLHKAYRHMTTWQALRKIDARVTNMACDYVINLVLRDLDKHGDYMEMPMREGKAIGLVDERFRGMNTKQIFDILRQEGAGDDGGGGSMDDHDWDGAEELSDKEKEALTKEIDQAIRQGVIAHEKVVGKGAGGMDRLIGELTQPEVRWQDELAEFVRSTCFARDTSSWRRVNRRYLGNNVYMPSMIGERVGHLVIGIDTSGSIGGHELNEFLSEVQGIATQANPEKVDLIYWDAEVAGHEEYDMLSVPNIVSSTKPRGGGGTDPTCLSVYLKEKSIKPDAIIMLTDGYIHSWGEWEAPILWTVVRNRQATAPVGKTIHIKE